MSSSTDFLKKIFSHEYYYKSLKLYSDAHILKEIHQKGIITSKELSQILEISQIDAYYRLSSLYGRKALKYLYDEFMVTSYTLREEIDNFATLQNLYSGEINDECILRLSAACNGQAQPVHLCIMADISMKEAKRYFKEFIKRGILSTVYNKNWQIRYIASNSTFANRDLVKLTGQTKQVHINKSVIQDAEIIKLAIESKGKLSATALCLKKEIDLNLAQKILDNLQERHVFDIHVNDNGTIEYWLNDKSLLE